MGVYDTATKLAREIKGSKEYINFKKCMKEVRKDKTTEDLLKDYRIVQVEIQRCAIRNLTIDKKSRKRIEDIQKRVNSNKTLNNYLVSEQNITKLMDNINKILAKAVEDDYK